MKNTVANANGLSAKRQVNSAAVRRTSYKQKRIVTAVSLLMAMAASSSAYAVLERVGPVSNASNIGGFPKWYQDTSGLAVEFCSPTNQAELNGGWCLLLPGDPPSVPEVFPNAFFDEHFYFAANAALIPASGGKANITLALESAFAADVVQGGQIMFTRIRVLLNPAPVTGTYRFIHPYGEEVINAVAGERIFFTDDVGISCAPGDFSCAIHGRVGPFLLASNNPGGAELPPVQGPGGLYIADPARIGAVTGSTLPNFIDSTGASRDHNIYRIEGPVGSGLGSDSNGLPVDYIETTDFSLMGRVFTGVMPGRVDVQRATYTHTNAGKKADVYATATPTTQGRLPGQARLAVVQPHLTFFDNACNGVIDQFGELNPPYSAPTIGNEIQMTSASPNIRWGQAQPAALPNSICVKDTSSRNVAGNIVPTYISKKLVDEVSISSAVFDSVNGSLTVQASSSDKVSDPTLSLAFGTFRNDMSNGQLQVTGLSAAPDLVTVTSSKGGIAEMTVKSDFGNGNIGSNNVPTAINDTFYFPEDSPAMSLNVLQNDSNVNGGTAVLTSQPRLGTASVDANTGRIIYTPALNANGTDQFTYVISNGNVFSNPGAVNVNITPVNDAPTAVNDSASTIAGTPVQINVLANDIDPDGSADIVGVANLTQPIGTQVTANGGVVTFNAAQGGVFYTFLYNAVDSAGVVSSNQASVTVQVAPAETIAAVRNEYIRSKSSLRADGTISPAANQTITIDFANTGGTVLARAGTVATNATGTYAFNRQGLALPNGATRLKITTSNGTAFLQVLTIK